MPNAVKPIPEGFRTITPYVAVPGVPKLMEFLKQTFAAVEIERHVRPDGTVQHAQMKVGDSMIMMGEPQPPWQPRPAAFYVYIADADAAYDRAIRAGATSIYPPTDQYYGDRSGGVTDPCGNQWFISTHVEDVSPDELQKRAAAQRK